MGGQEQYFINELKTIEKGLRGQMQAELWKENPDLEKFNRLMRTQADVDSAISNLLGASA